MVVDLLTGVFGAFGQVVSHLGLVGSFMAIVGLVLVYFLVKFLDRADRFLERMQRRWRRWTPATRWSLVLIVAVLAGPSVWAAFPKSTGALAVGLGLYVAYAWQGWRFIERYDLHDVTLWAAWSHHLQTARLTRRGTAAVNNATGKKGGRSRRPRIGDDGIEFPVEAPDGMSTADAVEFFNGGHANSAFARQVGWDEVRDTTAAAAADGTITVKVYPDTIRDDFFAESQPWPGMEKP